MEDQTLDPESGIKMVPDLVRQRRVCMHTVGLYLLPSHTYPPLTKASRICNVPARFMAKSECFPAPLTLMLNGPVPYGAR